MMRRDLIRTIVFKLLVQSKLPPGASLSFFFALLCAVPLGESIQMFIHVPKVKIATKGYCFDTMEKILSTLQQHKRKGPD